MRDAEAANETGTRSQPPFDEGESSKPPARVQLDDLSLYWERVEFRRSGIAGVCQLRVEVQGINCF
jgi:hypothetical protein